jgi:glycosyltransferase involved in cell wall biosynthesis
MSPLVARACSLATKLENPTNRGFVASVNRGMALHPERDVLLLNADTLLPSSNWLQRLRTAAYSHPRIATVTPFSNRATICSLPLPNVDNDLPPGHSVDSLDALCAQTNPGLVVEIPTAVGFCMFIKRAALNEAGLFDAERWAKGYGEENDFCFKAASLGWQHVAACDVFIQHHGSVSFQGEKAARVEANLAQLNALYPDYPVTIQRFLRRDPLAAARNRVAIQFHSPYHKGKKPEPQTLHITHAWGGGIEHHVNLTCAQSGYLLRPTREGQVELTHPASGFALRLAMADLASLSPAVLDGLRQLNIHAIHYHQWIGLPAAIWNLPQALGLAYDFSVHDYYSFCPRVVMLDHTGQFCGQAPVSRCTICLKARPLEAEIDIAYRQLGATPEAWRGFHAEHLARARQIIAPSKDAASRFSKAFPLKQVVVKPHEPPWKTAPRFKPLPKPGQALRIAVIGAIGPQKGYDQLLALAQMAETEAPQLRFYIVGYTQDDTPFEALGNVQITGKYKPHELQPLLAELDCHLALFLSPWPETYSYTLSEAVAAGLLPVAPDLGALRERMTKNRIGIVVPFPVANLLEMLINIYTVKMGSETASSGSNMSTGRPVLDNLS